MKRWIISGLLVALATPLAHAATVSAYSNSNMWVGHGTHEVDSILTFDTELCGIENGAPVDGPYIYWVLTASKASNADITIDAAGAETMTKRGKGSFHYLQTFAGDFAAPTSATATYDGSIDKKVNLTIGQVCTGGSIV